MAYRKDCAHISIIIGVNDCTFTLLFLIYTGSCDVLPNPGEILYGVDPETGDSTMTWCYPQAR